MPIENDTASDDEEPRTLKKFISSTTFHGVKEIYDDPSYISKTVWVLIFVACFTMATIEITGIVKIYINQPVATKSYLQRIGPSNISHIFDLVVCPQDWLDVEKVQKLNLSDSDLLVLLSFYRNEVLNTSNIDIQGSGWGNGDYGNGLSGYYTESYGGYGSGVQTTTPWWNAYYQTSSAANDDYGATVAPDDNDQYVTTDYDDTYNVEDDVESDDIRDVIQQWMDTDILVRSEHGAIDETVKRSQPKKLPDSIKVHANTVLKLMKQLKNRRLETLLWPLRKPYKNAQRMFIMPGNLLCMKIGYDTALDDYGGTLLTTQFDFRQDLSHRFLEKYNTNFTLMHYSGDEMLAMSPNHLIKIDSGPYKKMSYHVRFRKIVRIPGRPNSDCIEVPPHAHLPVDYAFELCAFLCVDKLVYQDRFNCTLTKLRRPTMVNLPYCPLGLIKQDRMNIDSVNLTQCIDQSKCEQKRFCTEWVITMYNQRYTPLDEMRIIEETYRYEYGTYAERTATQIEIYPDSFVEVIEEVPLMGNEQFLSAIGGQTGLWLGASIISLAHLLGFWCLSLCLRPCDEYRRKKAAADKAKKMSNEA